MVHLALSPGSAVVQIIENNLHQPDVMLKNVDAVCATNESRNNKRLSLKLLSPSA